MAYLSKLAARLAARPGHPASYTVTAHSRVASRIAATAVVAALALLAACGDEGTAPAPVVQRMTPTAPIVFSKSTPTVADLAMGLLRDKALGKTATVHKTIGPKGGSFGVPGGLTIVVPPGAVDDDVDFTATAYAGRGVAYDFGPHGITFNVPLTFEQNLGGTNWDHLPKNLVPQIQVGYFTDLVEDGLGNMRALVSEWEWTSLDVSHNRLTAQIPHFSGYMVSSGRR